MWKPAGRPPPIDNSVVRTLRLFFFPVRGRYITYSFLARQPSRVPIINLTDITEEAASSSPLLYSFFPQRALPSPPRFSRRSPPHRMITGRQQRRTLASTRADLSRTPTSNLILQWKPTYSSNASARGTRFVDLCVGVAGSGWNL